MEWIEIVMLSMALSADALSIGVSCGVSEIKIPLRVKCIICGVSVIITGTAVLAGIWLCGIIPEMLCRVLGTLMLGGLGVYMTVSALRQKKTEREKADTANVLNVSARILSNPVECDIDRSSNIDCSEAVFIGTALSADSFASGTGMGIFGKTALFIPIICGIFQMVFLCGGEYFARKICRYSHIEKKYFSVLSGLILILTALLRMVF